MLMFVFLLLSSSIGSDLVCSVQPYSVHLSVFYVLSIFSIQKIMESQERFNLRLPLFCWNLGLCIFSCIGTYMSASVHFKYLLANGVEASICGRQIQDGGPGVWSLFFILSKAPELIDTYFIVLRKQKLIFLHWYHHITVLMYCWYSYCLLIRMGQWFISMNYIVHSFMYGYYALRISRIVKLPIWVNMFITVLQLLQMIVGVLVNVYVSMRIKTGWYCDGMVETTYFYVLMSFAMYFSYFVLFANFFYIAYMKKSESKLHSSKSLDKTVRQEVKNGPLSNGYSTTSQLRHR